MNLCSIGWPRCSRSWKIGLATRSTCWILMRFSKQIWELILSSELKSSPRSVAHELETFPEQPAGMMERLTAARSMRAIVDSAADLIPSPAEIEPIKQAPSRPRRNLRNKFINRIVYRRTGKACCRSNRVSNGHARSRRSPRGGSRH